MMTDDEIQAIKERAAKRTPGEWHTSDDYKTGCFSDHVYAGPVGLESVTVAIVDDGARELANADFIAHAPADINNLLADREALIQQHESLRNQVGTFGDHVDTGLDNLRRDFTEMESRLTERTTEREALQARVKELEAVLDDAAHSIGGCGAGGADDCGRCLWCRARKVLDGAK